MNFHEIINTLFFYRKKIILFTASTFVFLYLFLLFIYPLTYSPVAKILPPDNQDTAPLSGLLAGGDMSSFFGMSNFGSSQLFAEIIKSRSASEYVIAKNGLLDYFDTDNIQYASGKLQKLIDANVTKERIIELSVSLSTSLFARLTDEPDSIKNLSARVTNSFIEALDEINREKINSRAKKAREYIEDQINDTKLNLAGAENDLRNFQSENKTIALDEQIKAAINNAASIKGEIIFTQIKLNTLKSSLQSDNQVTIALEKRLEMLEDEYDRLSLGGDGEKDFLPAFENVPQLSMELVRLMRDVKIQNEVLMLLQKQYYKEKIQENRDTPTVEVLDKALPPLRESSPRLVFSSFFGGLFAFMIICGLILVRENKLKKLRDLK